jgi:hypothetical protein
LPAVPSGVRNVLAQRVQLNSIGMMRTVEYVPAKPPRMIDRGEFC